MRFEGSPQTSESSEFCCGIWVNAGIQCEARPTAAAVVSGGKTLTATFQPCRGVGASDTPNMAQRGACSRNRKFTLKEMNKIHRKRFLLSDVMKKTSESVFFFFGGTF